MSTPNAAESITDFIRRAQDGDPEALRIVFEATYAELRAMARARLRMSSRNTLLDTTSLVHEAYLRFAEAGRLRIEDRQHFLKYASHAMRSVIVDFIRERVAQRRGGDAEHVTLNSQIGEVTGEAEREILHVHEALEDLAQLRRAPGRGRGDALLRGHERNGDRRCARCE